MLRCCAALAIALCVVPVPSWQVHLSGATEGAHADYQSPEQLLRRAGDALGGSEKLRAVDRLHITAAEWRRRSPEAARGRTFKLWLPDRFQSTVAGIVTHTLNGGHLTFDREVPPEVRGNAEQAIPRMFRRVALAFLLRAPDLGPPRLSGRATIAGLTGTLIEFATPDGGSLKLLLAPTSAQPLALVYSVRAMGSSEQLPDRIWRLEDYRAIDGVRFPFRLTIVDPTNELITEVRQITVNPPFTPADFPR